MKFGHLTLTAGDRRASGFTLVLVLIILALLAIVAVGFLASMTAERTTAAAYASRIKAEQSAQAGVDAAMATLRQAFYSFPDSATAWDAAQITNSDGSTSGGTTLYLRAVPNSSDPTAKIEPLLNPDDNRPPTNDTLTQAKARKTFALPLVSGVVSGKPVLASQRSTAVPTLAADHAELNYKRSATDVQGWIGSPPADPAASAPAKYQPVRAPWVELIDPATKTVTSRYAFWMEDESFRANVSYAGAASRGDSTEGNDVRQMSMPGFLEMLQPGAAVQAASIVSARKNYPNAMFPDSRGYSHGVTASGLAESMRFVTTNLSGGLNLSRHGSVRVNLNNLNDPLQPDTDTAKTSYLDSATVQKQIDKIVNTIIYHLPNFGQRFYRAVSLPDNNAWDVINPDLRADIAAGKPNDGKIYLLKTAANIRDYIDTDSQPTVIESTSGKVAPLISPKHPMDEGNGTNPYAAIGKEATPFITEGIAYYTWKATGKAFTLRADYIIELWNMSSRPVTAAMLGGTPVMRIADQPEWLTNSGAGDRIRMKDIEMDLSGVTFAPGTATVVTTMATIPADFPNYKDLSNPTNTAIAFCCPSDVASYPGAWSGVASNNNASYAARMAIRSSPNTDYLTELVFCNGAGYFDSITGGVPQSWNSAYIRFPKKTDLSAVQPDYIGGSLLGNTIAPSQLGDPRTNQEQLEFQNYATGGNFAVPDQTRYSNEDYADKVSPDGSHASSMTPGRPNANYVNPGAGTYAWGDYYAFYAQGTSSPQTGGTAVKAWNSDQATSASVIADGPMTTIAQLGDVFDAARLPSLKGSLGSPKGSRGGGRTFKVGQPDDRVNKTPPSGDDILSVSAEGWSAWRLTDIFSVQDERNVFLPGRINLNGVIRDYGAALRTALYGYKFQPQTTSNPLIHGDRKLNNGDLSETAIRSIIAALTERLKPTSGAPRPFFERGELSDLKNSASSSFGDGPDFTGGVANFAQVFDRGREEIVRRLIELTTTRGNIFTVYALGQSILQTKENGPKTVTSTFPLRVTFRLDPVWLDPSGVAYTPGTENFDPNDVTSAVPKRFKYPSRFDVVVLQSSN